MKQIDPNGNIFYYNSQGQFHREDGPAVVKGNGKEEIWYINGVLHREDGPAIKTEFEENWYWNGMRHRSDGPASVSDNIKYWFRYGLRHRTDGPAIEKFYPETGETAFYWCLDNIQMSYSEFLKRVSEEERILLILKYGPSQE